MALGNVLTMSGLGALVGFALPALIFTKSSKMPLAPVVLTCAIIQGALLGSIGLANGVYWVLTVAFLVNTFYFSLRSTPVFSLVPFK